MEAGACGLCIVTTRVGEIPYLWQDRKNALLVPGDSPKAMCEAVDQILNDPDLATTLSVKARENAEFFDFSVVMPEWDELLGRVALQELVPAGLTGDGNRSEPQP